MGLVCVRCNFGKCYQKKEHLNTNVDNINKNIF